MHYFLAVMVFTALLQGCSRDTDPSSSQEALSSATGDTQSSRVSSSNNPNTQSTPNSSNSANSSSPSNSNNASSSDNSNSSGSNNQEAFDLPGRIQAQRYTTFNEKDAIRDGAKTGPCADGEVDLDNTRDQDGECYVGWIIDGEWLTFNTYTNAAGQYDVILRATAGGNNKALSLSIDNKLVQTVNIPNNGLGNFSDTRINNVSIGSGAHTIRIDFETGDLNLNYLDIVYANTNTDATPSSANSSASSSINNTETPVIMPPSKGECTPAKMPNIKDIPNSAALNSANQSILAAFEVKGNTIVSKAVREQKAGTIALAYWQKFITRIPEQYRTQLIQFNVHRGQDPVGWFDGTGMNSNTGNAGYTISLSEELFETIGKPCDPFIPKRGYFDWTMVHEFGHLQNLLSGATEAFSQRFDGDGPARSSNPTYYPQDGSPLLTGNFVTSYAEREGGDEEAAETFTTYIMLGELPQTDSLASQKINFFNQQNEFPQLRSSLRISQ